MAQETLTVREIPAAVAAQALAGMEDLDPRGLMQPEDVQACAARGRCFEVTGEGVRMVYVITVRNGVAWVDMARGKGRVDLCDLLDGLLTEQAQGLSSSAFLTRRRGLVKKAQDRGWHVAGWVLRKDFQ